MPGTLTTAEKIRRLPWLLWADLFNSVCALLTVFGSVFVLFLSALGIDKTRIGFILSLLPFCGLVAPFIASTVARIGFRRIFLLFWTGRKLMLALLLLTGVVHTRWGVTASFWWVTGIVFGFALCRAIAETGYYPWIQQIVPNSIRGRFMAFENTVILVASMMVMGAASYILDHVEGLHGFLILIGAGVVSGFACVACYTFRPGGEPVAPNRDEVPALTQMIGAVNDRDFRRFMVSLGVTSFALAFLTPFVPLYLKDEVGLTEGNIVLLTLCSNLSGLVFSFPWGWSSDRFGSKPVMLTGLAMIMLLPVLWFLLPQKSVWSLPVTAIVSFWGGAAWIGWSTGWTRYLFVNAIKEEQSAAYTAVYYSWMGLVNGIGPLLAGRFLDLCSGIHARYLFFNLSAYSAQFGLGLLLLIAGFILLRRIRSDSAVTARSFVGMLVRGRPLAAVESLVRHSLAKDETTRIATTRRMAESRNPLSHDELIASLEDPSFNVRYEAIASIARTTPDPKLTQALLQVLQGSESELCVAAAWALGRLKESTAIEPLREALSSNESTLRAAAARGLAGLQDADSVPRLLQGLSAAEPAAERIAYASALGSLRAGECLETLLLLLNQTRDVTARSELALAVARIVGGEGDYMRLWRGARVDRNTALAHALYALKRNLRAVEGQNSGLETQLEDWAAAFGRGDIVAGSEFIGGFLRSPLARQFADRVTTILEFCVATSCDSANAGDELLILALHVIGEALRRVRRSGPQKQHS